MLWSVLRHGLCISKDLVRHMKHLGIICTNYVEASDGFSEQIDKILMEAVHIDTCPEREKCVTLLMDEMYIREDIVYEKHSGRMGD